MSIMQKPFSCTVGQIKQLFKLEENARTRKLSQNNLFNLFRM